MFFLGSLICHQLPERTILIDGMLLPVCARDTGIYTGVFACILFITFRRRWGSDRPPDLKYAIALCLMTLPMMIDGAASYSGIWESNNLTRIVTGGLFGLAIPIFLVGLKNFKVYEKNHKPVLKSWTDIAVLLAIDLLLLLSIYFDFFVSWWFVSTIIIGSMLFIIHRFVSTLVRFHNRLSMVHRFTAEALLFFMVLGLLYLFNRWVLWPLTSIV